MTDDVQALGAILIGVVADVIGLVARPLALPLFCFFPQHELLTLYLSGSLWSGLVGAFFGTFVVASAVGLRYTLCKDSSAVARIAVIFVAALLLLDALIQLLRFIDDPHGGRFSGALVALMCAMGAFDVWFDSFASCLLGRDPTSSCERRPWMGVGRKGR